MAKKSKEIELGGYRIQIDPLILVRRILTRQKSLLIALGTIGLLLTVIIYKLTPKRYTSTAEIVIRQEAFQDDYLRKLLNVVARFVGSDTEMMIIINELNLYASTRATLPYDLALRRMRQELKIDRPGGAISISFTSKNPLEAQRVVAFVTERIMTVLADLKDSPYRQQIDALQSAIQETEPRLKEVELKLFDFKERHPDIAKPPSATQMAPVSSPLADIEKQVDSATEKLRQCYSPRTEAVKPKRKRNSPACVRARQMQESLDNLEAQFTTNHPQVVQARSALRTQEGLCDAESASDDEDEVGANASPQACSDAYTKLIQKLKTKQSELEHGVSRTPELQRQWAELTSEVSTLDTALATYRDTRARTLKDRLTAANEFKDSFVLVDPPRVPELPSHPDRNQFLLFGAAVTFMVAMSIAVGRESLRQTFVDPREIEEQTGVPVLASLPNIADES